MYSKIYKQEQITSNSLKNTRKRNPKNTLTDNHSVKFDDVRIHYTSLPPSRAPMPSVMHEDNPIQLKLKVNDLIEEKEDSDSLFGIEDLDYIMQEVYYGELEEIASKSDVEERITWMITDGMLHEFEHYYNLTDYLLEYFTERSLNTTMSGESEEKSSPDLYTGVLSEHPMYHRVIKPKIMENIPKKHLQKLLRNKKQKNFDFYICNKHQLYVSNNGSTKAEIDTGYNIVVYQNGNCEIFPRQSDSTD